MSEPPSSDTGSGRTANRRPIPILVYHQIAPAPAKDAPFRSLYVSPEAFSRQMWWLRWLGYKGLSMSQLQPYLSGKQVGKVVGITFDDGYQNNLHNALPALVKNSFSSTCYAVSGLLGQTNLWDAAIGISQTPLMSASELRIWTAAGQEIGSHTREHINLLNADDTASREDIALGKIELEAVLDQPVHHFCYPFGQYDARHVAMARVLGFLTATTTQRSRCHSGLDLLQLPRVPVLRSTTLPVFWLKVATGYEDRRK